MKVEVAPSEPKKPSIQITLTAGEAGKLKRIIEDGQCRGTHPEFTRALYLALDNLCVLVSDGNLA